MSVPSPGHIHLFFNIYLPGMALWIGMWSMSVPSAGHIHLFFNIHLPGMAL